MKIRGRVLVLAVSMPVIAFAVIGGFMSKAIAREDSYQYLRIFEDVVSLILNNYVEEVNVDKVMLGAMHGLADGLDPDSAYLDVNQVKVLDKGDTGFIAGGFESQDQHGHSVGSRAAAPSLASYCTWSQLGCGKYHELRINRTFGCHRGWLPCSQKPAVPPSLCGLPSAESLGS